jgi:predicted nucleic acid-binding protein
MAAEGPEMTRSPTTSVYLDVCCLNRPFDDQTRERVRLESEAVLAILGRSRRGMLEMVTSEVAAFELSRIPDPIRRAEVEGLLELAARTVSLTEAVQARGVELAGLGFDALDALHLACAEAGGVTVLLTDRRQSGSAGEETRYDPGCGGREPDHMAHAEAGEWRLDI